VKAAIQAGIPTQHIDEQVDDVLPLVPELLKGMDPPYVFGFSVLTAGVKSALEVSRKLKELYPSSFVVFGGAHPTLATDEMLSYKQVDAVIRGDGEGPLVELAKCIRDGKDYRHIANLSYRKEDEQIVHNPAGYFLADIDTYSPFPYELFDRRKYDMGFLLSSRGCAFRCIFCSINAMPGGRVYRFRTPESIVGELELLRSEYGVKTVMILDDNFLLRKQRVYELIDHMRKRGLDKQFTFTFQARGDSADEHLYRELFSVGFKNVLFGLETASEEVMRSIKKDETVAECAEAVRLAKKVGMTTGGTFIFGLPGETHKDRMACVRFAKQLPLDVVRFNNAIPYPGTELYDMAIREGRMNIQGLYENFSAVAGITENPFRGVPFAYVSSGNTEDEIRRDILIGHFSVYMNVGKIFRSLFTSGRESKWINVGDSCLGFLKKLPALAVLGFLLGMKFLQMLYLGLLKRRTALPVRHFFKCLFSMPPAGER
jgi:radical SAM superfamily enzyme YgiQ (UPF0313 family)